jgi:ABC-type transport system involved in multi-copper enzyme maturation permease subunit
VIQFAEAMFGPLIVPECRRSAGRSWVILVRCLTALGAALVVLGVLWWWWFSVKFDPAYRPKGELHFGLAAVEGMAVAIALVITPAVLAGSLAGEKERGTLGLLLTTRVNSWQIVNGRLGGKLAQVGMLLLAGVPLGFLLAELADLPMLAMLGLACLPLALAFGVGGASLAASALLRRGRDALLAVYLAVFLGIPLILMGAESYSPEAGELAARINPFQSIGPLVWREDPIPAALTMLIWGSLGLIGLGVAAWRLRPACLRGLSGAAHSRGSRRRRVPPVDERRPMLWKELFIERISPLGRIGRWLGVSVGCILVGAGLGYTGLVAHGALWGTESEQAAFYAEWIGLMIAGSAVMVGYLIQLAVGLRAAVAISSERERGTWDGLLTSPLEGREIVVGKLCGSLHALRWLIAAAIWAWTLALICGAMPAKAYIVQLLNAVVIGASMAAVGVRLSLATATAAKSMALTVAAWLVLMAAFSLLALVIVGTGSLAIVLVWLSLNGYMLNGANPFAWSPISFENAWIVTKLGLYLALTALVVIESRYRFDRIAGRMTGGAAEVAVDRFLHGLPMAPIAIDDGAPLPAATAEPITI